MAKSTKSRFAILGMLNLVPNSSGYDIKKLMESSTQHFWKESFSSIYPVLQDMESEGLVLKSDNPAQGDRKRYLYQLSQEGKESLIEWLAKPAELEQSRSELLLKLFFGEMVPVSISENHVKEYQEILKTKKNVFLEIQENLKKEHREEPGLPYWLITLNFGVRQVDAALDWCADTIKQLKKGISK